MLTLFEGDEYGGIYDGIEYGTKKYLDPRVTTLIIDNCPWVTDYEGHVGVYTKTGKKPKFFFNGMRLTGISEGVSNPRPIGSHTKTIAKPVFKNFYGIGETDSMNRHEPVDYDEFGDNESKIKAKFGLYKSPLVDIVDGEFHGIIVGARIMGGTIRPSSRGSGYSWGGKSGLDGCVIPPKSKLKITALKDTNFLIKKSIIDKFPEGIQKLLDGGWDSHFSIENSTVNADITHETMGIERGFKPSSGKKTLYFKNILFGGSKINRPQNEEVGVAIGGQFKPKNDQSIECENITVANFGSSNKYGHYFEATDQTVLTDKFNLKNCNVRGKVLANGCTVDNSDRKSNFCGIWFKGNMVEMGDYSRPLPSDVVGRGAHLYVNDGRDVWSGEDSTLRLAVGNDVIPMASRHPPYIFDKVTKINNDGGGSVDMESMKKGFAVMKELLVFLGLTREQALKRQNELMGELIFGGDGV